MLLVILPVIQGQLDRAQGVTEAAQRIFRFNSHNFALDGIQNDELLRYAGLPIVPHAGNFHNKTY